MSPVQFEPQAVVVFHCKYSERIYVTSQDHIVLRLKHVCLLLCCCHNIPRSDWSILQHTGGHVDEYDVGFRVERRTEQSLGRRAECAHCESSGRREQHVGMVGGDSRRDGLGYRS